ncbi:MAG: hypothetical protein Q7S45_04280 [Candidatus Curtissbacteria bacterium]|nr:hypothetical protein [Candidatus Curtissbacteria bacterium]
MKKVLLFARDTGGANAIAPLYSALTKSNYKVEVYGKDFATRGFKKLGIVCRDITKSIGPVNEASLKKFLIGKKPFLVITGTNSEEFSEKYFWRVSASLGIPSIAILDHWTNLGIRFSKYTLRSIGKYKKNKALIFFPTKIFVMDETTSEEMAKEGIPSNLIEVMGQPYFEFLEKKSLQKVVNQRFGDSKVRLLFASEPLFDFFKGKAVLDKFLIYNELKITGLLLEIISKISISTRKDIEFIIKLHPKDKRRKYEPIKKQYLSKNLKIKIVRGSNSWEQITQSDAVISISSMLILEAIILKKPVICVQIGLRGDSPFLLVKKGLIKPVVNRLELEKELAAALNGTLGLSKFDYIRSPIENIVKYIENQKWQN